MSKSKVDYTKIDPLKKLAQKQAKTTKNSQVKIVEESYGESAFVWEEENCYRAFVIEGLGTKNLIADQIRGEKSYYDLLAQDTVAMIVNDLITVGAKPQVVNAYFAAGSSDWFTDYKRAKDLTEGFANACKLAGCVWGGGESPALSGIINDQSADLAGAAIGIIQPKVRLTLGNKIQPNDAILLIESSGIHANGISFVRSLGGEFCKKFAGKLLTPTHIYVDLVNNLFEKGIDIHYMVSITGHGFKKLMRANKNFTYLISQIPPVPQIFSLIQQESNASDEQMYGIFNMGAGFAVILPPNQIEKAQKIATENNLKSWNSGSVQKGEKKVVIQPKGITFEGSTLDLR
ncbi:MAG: phosphoribosylformylglycinamidine cyclo-ligase [Microgenomates group bacterium Gr01-1014_7]|nr:MAG: phosphoribosylformylglycinamidine cyclo-ligase [Microgenomates group bacterium Gr01-1014_7]